MNGPTPHLLDVNVLVALAWPNHVHHAIARAWFSGGGEQRWATTPVTELGFVRVSINPAAVPQPTTPALARELLERLTSLGGHEFWADNVAGITGQKVDAGLITGHRQVTDMHLLALAIDRRGSLVTFDGGIARAVPDALAGSVLTLGTDGG